MKISTEVFRMVRRINNKDFSFLVRMAPFFQILSDSGIDELSWLENAVGFENWVAFTVIKNIDGSDTIDVVLHEGHVHSVIDKIKYKLHKDLIERYIHQIGKDLIWMDENGHR